MVCTSLPKVEMVGFHHEEKMASVHSLTAAAHVSNPQQLLSFKGASLSTDDTQDRARQVRSMVTQCMP
jgi:hypothetical protein